MRKIQNSPIRIPLFMGAGYFLLVSIAHAFERITKRPQTSPVYSRLNLLSLVFTSSVQPNP
jgi:hypothetical protein